MTPWHVLSVLAIAVLFVGFFQVVEAASRERRLIDDWEPCEDDAAPAAASAPTAIDELVDLPFRGVTHLELRDLLQSLHQAPTPEDDLEDLVMSLEHREWRAEVEVLGPAPEARARLAVPARLLMADSPECFMDDVHNVRSRGAYRVFDDVATRLRGWHYADETISSHVVRFGRLDLDAELPLWPGAR